MFSLFALFSFLSTFYFSVSDCAFGVCAEVLWLPSAPSICYRRRVPYESGTLSTLRYIVLCVIVVICRWMCFNCLLNVGLLSAFSSTRPLTFQILFLNLTRSSISHSLPLYLVSYRVFLCNILSSSLNILLKPTNTLIVIDPFLFFPMPATAFINISCHISSSTWRTIHSTSPFPRFPASSNQFAVSAFCIIFTKRSI